MVLKLWKRHEQFGCSCGQGAAEQQIRKLLGRGAVIVAVSDRSGVPSGQALAVLGQDVGYLLKG